MSKKSKVGLQNPTTIACRSSWSSQTPYGVKLIGDQFQIDSESRRAHFARKQLGLGTFFRSFDEVTLILLLDTFDADVLGKLATLSRAFYTYGHHDAQWKTLFLRDFSSSGSFRFCGHTWRETYVDLIRDRMNLTGRPSHHPMQSSVHIFSDLLYRPYLCATSPILSSWLAVDNVDRRHQLTHQEFVDKYESLNKPVVVTGVVDRWPAFQRWKRDEYLIRAMGSSTLFNANGYQITYEDYLCYARTKKPFDDMPLYIFDKRFCEKARQLEKDYAPPVELFGEDLFALLGDRRPDFRWLIAGPAKSGSSFHIDPNSTSAWNAVIKGKKRWIMFPNHVVPPGVHPSDDGADVSQPVSLMEWFLQFHDQVASDAIQFTAREGDLVFVPTGWWHAVLNLEETVALTQNFVSERNVRRVLHFLKKKRDQVSGCGEGHLLYDTFAHALKTKKPSLWSEIERDEEKISTCTSFWRRVTNGTKCDDIATTATSCDHGDNLSGESAVSDGACGESTKKSQGFSFGFTNFD
eukprot:g490.t1